MMPVLLLSVPVIHLSAALQGHANPTAFATDIIELFVDIHDEQLVPNGTPVLIHASQPQTDPKNAALFSAGALVAGGQFVRWTRATSQGRHPKPELRPVTTDTDGPVCGFIEVSALRKLDAPMKIVEACRRSDGAKFSPSYVPRRPILARASIA